MSKDKNDDLTMVLDDALAHVNASTNDGWGQRRPTQQIAQSLDELIRSLRMDGGVDHGAIRLAFAPTGELQELSIANGWADEFLSLATRVDHLIADP